MELTKTQKILLGIASGWPLVYIFIFIAFIFGMIALTAGGPGSGNEFNPLLGGGFVVLMIVHMLTIFLTLALTVFYIVHAVKNTKLDSNMRIISSVQLGRSRGHATRRLCSAERAARLAFIKYAFIDCLSDIFPDRLVDLQHLFGVNAVAADV